MWELAMFIVHIIRELVEERDKRIKALPPRQSLTPAPTTRQPDAQPRTAAVAQAPTPRQKVAQPPPVIFEDRPFYERWGCFSAPVLVFLIGVAVVALLAWVFFIQK
jgi:hypothetical protein